MHELVPSLNEFLRLPQKGNLIPIYKEILVDLDTPVAAFKKVDNGRSAFLLESMEGGEKWGRYSFIGIDPMLIFRSKGRCIEVIVDGNHRQLTGEPLDTLRDIMKGFYPVAVGDLPRFYGGAVGYISYDMVRFFERLPEISRRDIDFYDSYFIIPEILIVFDNISHMVKIIANVHTDGSRESIYREAERKIEDFVERLRSPIGDTPDKRRPEELREPISFSSNFKREDFIDSVEKAKSYIRAGDIIQVVLSQRFETPLDIEPFDIYRTLRVINPSPYMFFLRLDDTVLIGSSPEILVRLEGDDIVTRPIAGTRPRGNNEIEDRRLEQELLKDPKEIAEHIMLVDLGRNDVGRVARTGTVRVDEVMTIERYSHVMHMVSNVTGKLMPDEDAFGVLKACFPAGTLTGAPKVRAMEIIEELEPNRRGVYGGCVGYFGFSGNMDMCITIRTLVIRDGNVYVQAGAGIVADSVPEREFEETVNKAKAMLQAVEMAREYF